MYSIVPVFLDHVFQPGLQDEAFKTEVLTFKSKVLIAQVVHVDGEGKYGGVVFCEMQVG